MSKEKEEEAPADLRVARFILKAARADLAEATPELESYWRGVVREAEREVAQLEAKWTSGASS